MGLLWVSSRSKVRAVPTIPKMKKKSIKLNYNLAKAPKMMGLRAEATVPMLLTALTPIPTTRMGKSSTM